MKDPFPGMNPWLEEYWQDVPASLLVYARDSLNAALPPDLHARVDERLAVDAEDEKPHLGQQILRHLEIVDSHAHVITAFEVLSPSNKEEAEARNHWQRKRRDYLVGGINVVEIDLLRGGSWVLPDRSRLNPTPQGRVCYHVAATRPPWLTRYEFYVLPLRERLPAIRVPLRHSDTDVALDLQLLIDQCYERGRYGSIIDYAEDPHPPLPEEEAAWAREVLTRHDLPAKTHPKPA